MSGSTVQGVVAGVLVFRDHDQVVDVVVQPVLVDVMNIESIGDGAAMVSPHNAVHHRSIARRAAEVPIVSEREFLTIEPSVRPLVGGPESDPSTPHHHVNALARHAEGFGHLLKAHARRVERRYRITLGVVSFASHQTIVHGKG